MVAVRNLEHLCSFKDNTVTQYLVLYSMLGFRNNEIRRKETKAVNDRFTLIWQPMDLSTIPTAKSEISNPPPDSKALELLEFLDKFAASHISKLIDDSRLSDLDASQVDESYLDWCQEHSKKEQFPLPQEEIERFQIEHPQLHDFAQVVADNQKKVILRNRQGLRSLLTQDQMGAFFSSALFSQSSETLVKEILRLVKTAHSNGKQVVRILELNAAAGALTEAMGKAILMDNTKGCHIDYCCTDGNFKFASSAASKSEYRHISPHCLDVSVEIREQEVPPADIIFGIDVLVSNSSIELITQNLKKIMLPGGYMAFLEPCGVNGATGSTWRKCAACENKMLQILTDG